MASFKPVQAVVSDDHRPGHRTLGFLLDGAFVPVADPPAGHVRDRAKVEKASVEDGSKQEPPAPPEQ